MITVEGDSRAGQVCGVGVDAGRQRVKHRGETRKGVPKKNKQKKKLNYTKTMNKTEGI